MTKKNREELHIRNMVCDRCVMVVRETLEELGLTVVEVELGKAVVETDTSVPYQKINKKLQEYGFELIRSKNRQLVERIKTRLIEYVQQLEESEEVPKLSEYLSEELNQNYSSLSSVFSENEDITIEKYVIHLKIERVKELLSYGEMTLSEIAWKLNYSSVAHLSGQFKQITGMSVTDYKKARESFRKPLDGIESK
ncbi:MAG: AraC family transcriptional regulator [Balneolaceae bacterium]|nr:AraC family transcriptional regulator [Balneolaceae bacterium]